jgi:hypothetical protein
MRCCKDLLAILVRSDQSGRGLLIDSALVGIQYCGVLRVNGIFSAIILEIIMWIERRPLRRLGDMANQCRGIHLRFENIDFRR